MMYSYLQLQPKHNLHYETFQNTFKQNMKQECQYSLFQALKILDFMGLGYKTIAKKNDKTDIDSIRICNYLYKENTSVFSYYIITSLLMNNYNDFMSWCLNNNNIFLQFKKTPGNLEAYIDFISNCCKNPHIKKNINIIEKSLSKTGDSLSRSLKMTQLELDNVIHSD